MRTQQGRSGRKRSSGWLIGRIGGAPVLLAPSWLIIAAFLTWIFLPLVRDAAPGLGPIATVVAAAGFPILLAISVLLHELGHGLTARGLGVPVTEYVITLWGGHTQFDTELRSPGVSAAVSVAGPVVNAALAYLSWLGAGATEGVLGLLLWASAYANGFVAAFNLLPGLPLDGGRVLEAIVWKVSGDRHAGTLAAGSAGRILAVAIAVAALGWPLTQGRQASIVNALVIILVSAFLWAGASQAVRAATGARRAAAVDLMALARPAATAPATTALADVDANVPTGVAVVLVAPDGTPVGLVDPVAAGRVPAHLRPSTGLQAVAYPLAPASVVTERRGMKAVEAMSVAQHHGPAAVLVDPATRAVLGVVDVARVAYALQRAR